MAIIETPTGGYCSTAGLEGVRDYLAKLREVYSCAATRRCCQARGQRAAEDRVYCIFTVSSKVNSTLAIFPASTFTGAGWPGVLLYIPSDEPGGGGPCRSA
jgi:hypothetical protein